MRAGPYILYTIQPQPALSVFEVLDNMIISKKNQQTNARSSVAFPYSLLLQIKALANEEIKHRCTALFRTKCFPYNIA